MLALLGRALAYCCGNQSSRSDEEENDRLIWSKDLGKHSQGDFSFAAIQANTTMEDQGRVEAGINATFIGVFDGHGGPEASSYACRYLYHNLLRLAKENEGISVNTLEKAFTETENDFLDVVRSTNSEANPDIISVGSCCLVGVIWGRTLYLANLGDCRAVLGRLVRSTKILAKQLTADHNCNRKEIRKELRRTHPHDTFIVTKIMGCWRIKGLVQTSRSLGDAHLKLEEFALRPSSKYRIAGTFQGAVIRADPDITTRNLQQNDKFVIFASDGLWEVLSNQEAVEIVHKQPRLGIAKRLIASALDKFARMNRITCDEIRRINIQHRRRFHDDMTVVVVFLDTDGNEAEGAGAPVPGVSVKSFVDSEEISSFNFARGEEARTSSQSVDAIVECA